MFGDQIVVATDVTGKKIQKYVKKQVLGHGGFAKCYLMVNTRTQQKFAGKVIKIRELKDDDSRQKIIQEIQIHKSLSHQNICKFYDMFEYDDQIYIILQLCQNNSLKQFLKNRVRITEFQAKCYLLQIISGLEYLHKLNILHRDIKLGNIFLNYKMEVKIGDFGLSTKLKNQRQKRFTTCGTPNYIAPEILAETGHSFEVDIWAVGIILYALVIGKPPFQSDTVENTYRRIKQNNFSFPKEIPLTPQCKSLIKSLLEPNPKYRIGLQQIKAHEFFCLKNGRIPLTMPPYTISIPPQSSYLKQFMSEKHMKLAIFPRKISNMILPHNQQETEGENQTRNHKNGLKKKMPRVLSLDKQLFKTSRTPSNDQKSTLNRCHIYNSKIRLNSMLKTESGKKLYESFQNNKFQSQRQFGEITRKHEMDLCEVVCYFDLRDKYGMAFLLSNGNYGVIFNDKSTLTKIQNPSSEQNSFFYIYYHNKEQQMLRQLPETLRKKNDILKLCNSRFQKYKRQNINLKFQSMTYAKKFVSFENFFLIQLSNDVLQFFWKIDTVVLRGKRWINWKIGRQNGQSRLSNLMLPSQVREKVQQIRRFLVYNQTRRKDEIQTDFNKQNK